MRWRVAVPRYWGRCTQRVQRHTFLRVTVSHPPPTLSPMMLRTGFSTTRLLLIATLTVAAACGGGERRAEADASGLATVFDSTNADTVVARVAGEVPPDRMRTLTEELRIQPGAEDTTSFSELFGFAVGPEGRLVVPDEATMRIFLFGADGALRRVIGRKGAGPGEFGQFNGLAVLRDGRLVVADLANARLSFFTADGDYESAWRVPAGFYTQDQVRTDTSGAVRLVQPLTAATATQVIGRLGLVRVSADGAVSDSQLPPDLGTRAISYIAEANGGRSQMYARYSPRDFWTWHRDGHFVSANGARAVIEVGRPGRALRIVRDAPAIPVPPDELAWDRERITISMRRNDPSWTWRGDALPETKPPIVALRTTRDGRIWVGVALPSTPIPEAERDEQRPNASPVARWRSATAYEVFEADGRFVGRVSFPARTQLMDAEGDLVWTLQRDADGLPGVVRSRVTPAFAARE